jgi:hypothetical protein
MESLQDGKPVVANSPIGNLKPGQYEVRVTVTQAGRTARRKTFVTIE